MQRTFVRIMSVIGVCLLAVGACRDLAISEVLYDPSGWLGILFQEGWPLLLKLLLASQLCATGGSEAQVLLWGDAPLLSAVRKRCAPAGARFCFQCGDHRGPHFLSACLCRCQPLAVTLAEGAAPTVSAVLSSALFYRVAPHQRPQAGLGPCPLSTDGRSEPVLCLVSPLWCAGNFFSQRTYELVYGDRARRAVASLSTAAFACAPHRCGGRRQHPAHDALPGDHGRTFCQ